MRSLVSVCYIQAVHCYFFHFFVLRHFFRQFFFSEFAWKFLIFQADICERYDPFLAFYLISPGKLDICGLNAVFCLVSLFLRKIGPLRR